MYIQDIRIYEQVYFIMKLYRSTHADTQTLDSYDDVDASLLCSDIKRSSAMRWCGVESSRERVCECVCRSVELQGAVCGGAESSALADFGVLESYPFSPSFFDPFAMASFQPITSVSRKSNHVTSESLKDLHPYFSEDNLKHFAKEIDPQQVERAFGLRATEKLAELSRYPDLSAEARATALRIVVALCVSQEEKQLAISHGLIQSCTTLLSDDDSYVREQAGYVIATLATGSTQSQPILKQSNTVDALTGTLTDTTTEVGDAASLALLNISVSRRGSDMVVATENAVSRIVGALLGTSLTTSLYLVSTLVNVARYFKGVEVALDAGVVGSVIELLRSCPDSRNPNSTPGLKVQTLNAIWNLANHLSGKDQLIGKDAVEHIAPALSDSSTDVRRCAAGALMALAVHEYGKQQISEYATTGLTRLLQDDDAAVRANAKTAIFLASENRDTRFDMVQELMQSWPGGPEVSCELVELVFGQVAAESLNQLLDDEVADDTRDRAVLSLMSIAARPGEGGNNAVMSTLYIVEKLARLTGSNKPSTRNSAYQTLKALVAEHKYAGIRLKTFYNDPVNTLVVNGEFGDIIEELLRNV